MVHSPLIWPFDAGFAVVCVSVVDVEDFGLVLRGRCSDENFIFWVWNGHSGKEIIFKKQCKMEKIS